MNRHHRMCVLLGSAMSATALAAALTVPAQAVTVPAQAVTVPARAGSGTGWRIVFSRHYGPQDNFSLYFSIVAPRAKVAWAFGGTNASGAGTDSPVAVRWNGSRWRAAALPAGLDNSIGAASASSPANIWAVSTLGQYALRWNGTRWSVAKRWKNPGELTGVTAISRTDVWVFGAGGFEGGLGTWHFNGHSWARIGGVANGIDQASALSRSSIWAIGSTSSPDNAVVHFNGRKWRRSSATALSGAQFSGILALSPKNVWVAGQSSGGSPRPVLVHFNGMRWKRVTIPGIALPGRIISDGRGGMWLVAQSESSAVATWRVLHRSRSGTWTSTRISSGPGTGLFGLALIPGGTSLWAVGSVATKLGSAAAIYAHGRIG